MGTPEPRRHHPARRRGITRLALGRVIPYTLYDLNLASASLEAPYVISDCSYKTTANSEHTDVGRSDNMNGLPRGIDQGTSPGVPRAGSQLTHLIGMHHPCRRHRRGYRAHVCSKSPV